MLIRKNDGDSVPLPLTHRGVALFLRNVFDAVPHEWLLLVQGQVGQNPNTCAPMSAQ